MKHRYNRLGKKHSEETKLKMSKASKGHQRCLGNVHSEETKRKISEGNKGKILSEEHKKKLSKARKGLKLSDKWKEKISKSNIGKHYGSHLTEEGRQKLSESHKGKKLSEEHKTKLSKAWEYDKHITPETIQNMKEACAKRKLNSVSWHSEETKRKIAETTKRNWDKKHQSL